jgi:hypothetical protein
MMHLRTAPPRWWLKYSGECVHSDTLPFTAETEVTGHIMAHLNVSCSPHQDGSTPSDIDLFVTIRHLDPDGNESTIHNYPIDV